MLNAERLAAAAHHRELVESQTLKISQTSTASIIALVLALLIAGSISFWLTRSISGPTRRSGIGNERRSAGGYLDYDLKNIPSDRTDEFGRLSRELSRNDPPAHGSSTS